MTQKVEDNPKLDFHNHVIPGVDDGAVTIEESLSALTAMKAQGIRHIIASPHLRASAVSRRDDPDGYFARVNTAWHQLVAASKSVADVAIYRGFEILPMYPIDLSDPTLRLAGRNSFWSNLASRRSHPTAPTRSFRSKCRTASR